MMRIGLVGVFGRMGQAVLAAANNNPNISINIGYVREKNPSYNYESAPPVTSDWDEFFEACDSVIYFATAEGIEAFLTQASHHNKPLVVGATGLSEGAMAQLERLGKVLSIVYAPNMSRGVTALQIALKTVSAMLPDFSCEIHETHHIHKKDRPSGTAIMLAQAVNPSSPPPIASVREGEVFGDHEVVFTGPGETLLFKHQAEGLSIFADGALEAARWILAQPRLKPGLYSMTDVLLNGN